MGTNNTRRSSEKAYQFSCQNAVYEYTACGFRTKILPLGPKTPCEVLGSARFLLFLNSETVISLDFLVAGPSSSSEDDSDLMSTGMPTCSFSSPNTKNLRHASRHGRRRSLIVLRRRSMKARFCIDINGLRSRSISGVPSGWGAKG